jgi:sugar transferase (PEP-CTERM system associated)
MVFDRSRRLSLRTTALFLGDVVCLATSLLLAVYIRLGPELGSYYLAQNRLPLLLALLIYLLVFYIAGMYERQNLSLKRRLFLPLAVTSAIAMVAIILVFYAKFELLIGRGVMLLFFLLALAATLTLRYFYRASFGYQWFTRNTLIIGNGREAARIVDLMTHHEDPDYRVLGIVLTGEKGEQPPDIDGEPVLGGIDDLRPLIDLHQIETLIVVTSLGRELHLLKILRPLRYSGIEIMDYASFYEKSAHEIPLDHIDDEWLMHAAMNSSRIHIRKLKRIMDVTAAIIGLALSLPISLAAAIAVRLDSPGPILFRQVRTGLDGKPYTLMKFRSMRADAEKDGAVWAKQKDDRVTRVGQFLRKSRIDEIPQLINVLRGEMSLVGPRPERPEFIDELAERIPFYKERLLVPPGVTGWAQVNYPYTASIKASRRKVQFDLYYIKHMSLFLDIVILLRTLKTILVGLRHSEEIEPSIEIDAKLAKKLDVELSEKGRVKGEG